MCADRNPDKESESNNQDQYDRLSPPGREFSVTIFLIASGQFPRLAASIVTPAQAESRKEDWIPGQARNDT